MKKCFAILGLGCLSGLLLSLGSIPSQAGDASLVTGKDKKSMVNAQRSSDVFVTVYGNRYAQIEETRRVHLDAGHNSILLEGIAAQYRSDSLRVLDTRLAKSNATTPSVAEKKGGGGKAFTYLSSSYQPANLSLDKLLALSVGKQITVVAASGERYSGTLLSVSANMVVLRTAGAKVEVVPVTGASLEQLPAGVSSTASLVVEAYADIAGDYDFHFMYETGGITWSASHSLIFDDEKSLVESWDTTVAIVNNSGATFENATVSLLPGSVTNGEASESRVYGARMMAAAPAAASDVAINSVGDQTTYTLPDATTLVDGQSRQLPLFSGRDVPVKRDYFIPANSPGYYARGKQEVSIRLEVENCENNKLGKPLPAGPVKVYQHAARKDKKLGNGPVQLVGSANIGAKAVDEVFQLTIGTSSEIKWERVLVDSQEVTAPGAKAGSAQVRPQPGYQEVWEEHTYKINVYNFKRDRDVEVNVEVSFPTDQSIAGPWKLKEDVSQAHTKLSVPKSSKADVQYKVKERVR